MTQSAFTNVVTKEPHVIARFSKIIENLWQLVVQMPGFYVLFDADGQILLANQEFERFLNTKETAGSFIANLLGEDFWDLLKDSCLKVLGDDSNRTFVASHLMHKSLFKIEWTLTAFHPLSIDGKSFYQMHGNDRTEILALSQSLEEKDKALSSYAAKLETLVKLQASQKNEWNLAQGLMQLGEIAGGIAHEINNPIQVLQMSLEILIDLKQKNQTIDPQFLEKKLGNMMSTVQRMAQIVISMRQLSQSHRAQPLNYNNVSLNNLIETSLMLFYEKFQKDGILVTTEINEEINLYVQPTQISQMFVNLLQNSYQAILHNEQKWIKIKASIDQKNHLLRIRFIDSGHGLPLEAKALWSKRFFTTKNTGMGLGLAIVKRILKEHQGSIVYVEEEENTTFEVKLPIG